MPQKAPKKAKPEEYRGWRMRFIEDRPDGRKPIWQADNNDIHNRKRISGVSRQEVLEAVDKWIEEREKYGTEHSIDDGAREATLRAMRELGERATLDEIVKFWKDRHPNDGRHIPLGKMVERFLDEKERLVRVDPTSGKAFMRPATFRHFKQKLTTLKNQMGEKTPLASIGAEEMETFIGRQGGGVESRKAWLKILNPFFEWCKDKPNEAIIVNPLAGYKLPAIKTIRKPPATWAARDVEAFLRIAEEDAPDMVAGFAILWFAGLRPTELAGQYGLEDARITEAKSKLAQATTNFEAEKMRLGLARGRGADTAKQAANRATLEESPQAQALTAAREHLAKMQEKYGGEAMPGLQWADICLDEDEQFISIRAETSKVQERRHVEILPNLKVWLTKYRKVAGPVVANPTAFRRARAHILSQMGGAKWTADVCRHTFASFHYKKHGNRDRLAAAMGHSAMSREIEKHYKDATVSRADAERFWEIVPEGMELKKSKQAERMRA